MNCVMCSQEFLDGSLDFLGRCDGCFEVYKNLPDSKKPNLGIPSQPGYNSTWNKS